MSGEYWERELFNYIKQTKNGEEKIFGSKMCGTDINKMTLLTEIANL